MSPKTSVSQFFSSLEHIRRKIDEEQENGSIKNACFVLYTLLFTYYVDSKFETSFSAFCQISTRLEFELDRLERERKSFGNPKTITNL